MLNRKKVKQMAAVEERKMEVILPVGEKQVALLGARFDVELSKSLGKKK